MTLLHIDKATYDRLKAQGADGSTECIEDPYYGWARVRWYEAHGEGFFLYGDFGEEAIPDGLVPGPDAAEVARKNLE